MKKNKKQRTKALKTMHKKFTYACVYVHILKG